MFSTAFQTRFRNAAIGEVQRRVKISKCKEEHLGISVAELNGEIVVEALQENSVAFKAGLRVGDCILEV